MRRRQNPKVRLIEKDTLMTVLVSVEGARECGVIVRRNKGRRRVGHRVNMVATSREPALKYSNSGFPVHLTRPG